MVSENEVCTTSQGYNKRKQSGRFIDPSAIMKADFNFPLGVILTLPSKIEAPLMMAGMAGFLSNMSPFTPHPTNHPKVWYKGSLYSNGAQENTRRHGQIAFFNLESRKAQAESLFPCRLAKLEVI
jgi:hypothetical protein